MMQTAGDTSAAPSRLALHLEAWLGDWPPPRGRLLVTSSPLRERARAGRWWHPVLGIRSPLGTVLSVPEHLVPAVDALGSDIDAGEYRAALARLLGIPDLPIGSAIFRWSDRPSQLPAAGRWVGARDPRLPHWLREFDGDVLLATDEQGRYVAGLGVKRHDAHGHEIAVGTEPAMRGKGLARRLVATAAQKIVAEGAVPTYIHDPGNDASARVAAAAGFPDRGWRVYGTPPLRVDPTR